jgi:hypothetical protein
VLAHEAVYDEVVQRLGLRQAFGDDDDALTLANGVEQGLTASV